jgi:hypothetical protein
MRDKLKNGRKYLVFKDFCVPLSAWDRVGTKRDSGTTARRNSKLRIQSAD